MPNSPVHQLRIDPTLKAQIDRARGRENLSAWLREAAIQRLQSERGLGPEFVETLANLTAQLRGLGTNLNQLAHAANEGRPVTLDRKLARDINAAITEARVALSEIRSRLPYWSGLWMRTSYSSCRKCARLKDRSVASSAERWSYRQYMEARKDSNQRREKAHRKSC